MTTNPANVIVWRGVVKRPRRKMVRNPESQAQTWVDDGIEEADCEVTINVADIASDMGHRALQSKAGKSAVLHGRIKARVSNRRRKP